MEGILALADEEFGNDFVEYKSDGSNGNPIPASTKYAVVFLVEATGKLRRHMETLKSAYLAQVLSYFRTINAVNSDTTGVGWPKDAWYGFVFYYSGDAGAGQEVWCGAPPTDNEEAALEWFDNIPTDRASFMLSYECCFLEALFGAVRYVNGLIIRHLRDSIVEKHFILVNQSSPFEKPLRRNPCAPQTFLEATQLLIDEQIHFSVISTRKNRLLRELFNGTRDLSVFVETDANVDPRHMVLLNNITVRPVSEKLSPGSVGVHDPTSFLSPIPVAVELSNSASDPVVTSPQSNPLVEVYQMVPIPVPLIEPDRKPLRPLVFEPSQKFTVKSLPSEAPSPRNILHDILPNLQEPSSFKLEDSPRSSLVNLVAAAATPHRASPQQPISENVYHSNEPKYSVPAAAASNKPLNSSVESIYNQIMTNPRPGFGGDSRPMVPNSVIPSPISPAQNPQMGFLQQGQNKPPLQNMPGRVMGDRCIVWEGILEWATQAERSRQPCQIWVPLNEYIKAERWPNKLTIQFLPQTFSQVIKPYMDSPIKVSFNFKTQANGDSAARQLRDQMCQRSPGSVGCILIPSSPNHPIHPLVVVAGSSKEGTTFLELRVIVVVFNQEMCIFQGFIPRDQVGFVDALRQQLQINQQNQTQQPQQLIQQLPVPQMQQQQQQTLVQQQQMQQNNSLQQQRSHQFGLMNATAMDNTYGMLQQQPQQQQQMPQQQQQQGGPQGSLGIAYQQHSGTMGQQLSQDQLRHQQQQMRYMLQQQQHQQQQQQQQQPVPQQMNQLPMSGNPADPQLRQLLQNSSPRLHAALNFDK